MKRTGHSLAVLLFAFTLLFGTACGAAAHADMQAAPSGHHHGDTRDRTTGGPGDGVHKAALTAAASCCPAAETSAAERLPAPIRQSDASWPLRPNPAPDRRAIAPETPPPKPGL